MRKKVELSHLENILSKMYFQNEGKEDERKYGFLFEERFPNLQIFWRYFIIPATRRIENENNRENRNGYRAGVHDIVRRITSLHYSIFRNLLYCWEDSEDYSKRMSYFYDFWVHLVSALDLTEMLLVKFYGLKLGCHGKKVDIPELNKDTFLDGARKWYCERYSREYNDFLKKCKPVSWRIHRRMDLLANYFICSKELDDYSRYSQSTREYRNLLVHSPGLARIEVRSNTSPSNLGHLVPRKDRISEYKDLIWGDQFTKMLRRQGDVNCSVDMMKSEFDSVQDILNKLWIKPIHDTKEMFETKNETFQQEYNIELL